MKKIFLIFSIICICKISKAQNQNTSPYPPPVVTPGNQSPTQSGPPYNGSNPSGMPNTGYTLSTPPNTAPVNPFIIDNEVYPVNPSTVTPVTPTSNVTPKQFQRLFQDPVKTPKNPRLKAR